MDSFGYIQIAQQCVCSQITIITAYNLQGKRKPAKNYNDVFLQTIQLALKSKKKILTEK